MARQVTIRNVLGYSSINFLGSGAQNLIGAWLMYFYTTVCSMSPLTAGAIFTITRVIDALGNPILGFISDNFGETKLGKKFGRRKFFILAAIPVIAVIYPLLWLPGQSVAFYFIVNLIYEVAYTMIFVTGTTLPAEMTQDAKEKAKIVGGKQYCGTIAATIAAFIPGRFFLLYGKNSPDAFLMTGLVYGGITTLALIFFYFNVFERDPKEIKKEESVDSVLEVLKKLAVDIPSSLRNKSFRLHTIMFATEALAKQIEIAMFTYFAVFVVFTSKVTISNISSIGSIVSAIVTFLFIIAAYKYGGPKTYRIGIGILAISLIGYTVIAVQGPVSTTILMLTIFTLINISGRIAVSYVPTYQMVFMADIDEAITGKRREGIYSGANNFLYKVATSLQPAIVGIGLTIFEFNKAAEIQSNIALIGICVLTILVPAILLAIGWIASIRLKLNTENHKLLVQEVNRIKNGGSMQEVTPRAKEAIEVLTGWKYEKCFGNNNVAYRHKTGNEIKDSAENFM